MKKFWLSLLAVGAVAVGVGAMMVPVMADDIGDICEAGNNIPDDLKEAAGCQLADTDKTVMPAVVYIINVALSLVGIVAVVVVIYGAITYVISTGDAVKLNRAKNSIIYGIVGLVVALMAYAVVYFVSQSIWG